MNSIYTYNGEFINLLNLIIYLLKNKIVPSDIKVEGTTGSLFDYIINLRINNTIPMTKFIKKFNSYNMHLLYYVYLSNDIHKELIIYYYLLNYFKYKDNLCKMRNLKCVSEVLRISKHVGSEAHKFKGFVRFRELKNNILYAEISPDNNIIEILSCHFRKRLSNEFFLIKDKKRGIISVYDKKDFYLINDSDFKLKEIILGSNEMAFEDLWKTFYDTIAIKERHNERCRCNFMPKKYWNNILEVSDRV